jgi:hypothetical protein
LEKKDLYENSKVPVMHGTQVPGKGAALILFPSADEPNSGHKMLLPPVAFASSVSCINDRFG